ncbi:L-threonylcarbamoyladenylate synthase [Patescibacteria group bacterium]|nr:L-threonylcarbamoyladenylate synthase [Patescibacteria group bacterium]MCL5433206.1 L-threonylcarbamoyladenylate synthase [Patescibacteria group bacterium]
MDEKINKAIDVLKRGGVVIFPTDTAFGIGCCINNKSAVEKLFKIRKRQETKPVPVLVDSMEMAKKYLMPVPEEVVDKLIRPYWPGALTIVLKCKVSKVLNLVRAGGETLGVRMPNHPVPISLIKGLGVPILGSSANFSGENTPYEFKDLNPKLIKMVDYVLPGQSLANKASTIIDCTKTPWKILREGAIQISNFQSPTFNNSKNKAILLIDTADNKEIRVGLKIDGKEYVDHQVIDFRKAQVVLPMIDKILKKHKLNIKNIKKIEVNQGPGSFTGIRVGISVANVLSFVLKIPVNSQRAKKYVAPKYI